MTFPTPTAGFQPTPPSEKSGDSALNCSGFLPRGFNPRRPPRRAATGTFSVKPTPDAVSTHAALREERRLPESGDTVFRDVFQPTPPSEKSGDSLAYHTSVTARCFNPRRPPRRAATGVA